MFKTILIWKCYYIVIKMIYMNVRTNKTGDKNKSGKKDPRSDTSGKSEENQVKDPIADQAKIEAIKDKLLENDDPSEDSIINPNKP